MPIQFSSLPEEAQQELAALITQTPGFSAAYAYRLRSSPRGGYTTTVVASADEARIFINANFEEVVGIPLPLSIRQDGLCRDRYIANLYRDAKWYAQSEYWVRPVAFVRAEDEVKFNQSFSATVCPETGYVHYQPSPIQKPAHKAVTFHSDGSISLRPKFKVGEQVLLHKVITWAIITGYVVSGDGLFYTSDRGDLTEDEALSEKELDRCPQCAAQALYADHCHDCGWDVEDDSPCRHPALTAAERNDHLSLVWK